MNKIRLTIIAVSFCFFGCAKPIYANDSQADGQQISNESKATCSLKLQPSGLCLVWFWEVSPTSSNQGSFIFKTYRLNNYDETAVETDPVGVPTVLLWMPSMGHGSSPTSVERLDIGTYRAKNIYFVMPGEWEIKFQVKENGAVKDEAVVPFTY